MRYFNDQTRAISRGLCILTQLKKITKIDDDKAKKKYKQTNILKLEFKQGTMMIEYVISISNDYLYKYDNK